MTSSASNGPVSVRPTSASWWFRSSDGRLILWQFPNPALCVWLIAVVLGWFDLSAAQTTAVDGVRHGALLVWALDELVRGASPFRRLLGAVVFTAQLASLFLGWTRVNPPRARVGSSGLSADDVQALGRLAPGGREARGGTTPRRRARRASTTPTTNAGSCSTKSRSTWWPNHSSRWRTSAPACMPEDQPPAGVERADQGRDRVGQLGGRQVDQRVPPEHRRPPAARGGTAQPPQVADLEASRPGKRRRASLTIAGERSIPVASAPPSARYAVTCPGPEPTSTTGCPAAWASTRSSSQVSNGSPCSSSTRWSA